MNRTHLARWLVPAALAIVSAGPSRHPEDLVRQGNAAFARAEYEQALKLYEQAEERATDPGLLAFNEGAALYRAGRTREAELHYRCALEGASGSRQARALHDLGNCLLRQAVGSDVKGLAEALGCYEACLVHADADPALRASAARNLELARLLWHQARQAAKETPSAKDPDSGDSTTAGDNHDKRAPGTDLGLAGPQPDGKGRTGERPEVDGNQKAIETSQETPRRGNLRPLPDRDALAPLAPEDVAGHLEGAARRIVRDQRDYRQAASPAVPSVKDW